MNGLAATLIGFAAAVASLPSAVDKPILKASTERSTPGAIRPSRLLARTVLDAMDKDSAQQVDECIGEQDLKHGDYATLLSAVKIHNGAGRNLWFVRPTLTPYCSGFYGAHLFRYFFVEEIGPPNARRYHVLFQNSGDAFGVYSHVSHGVNDIEATGCIATGCRSARLSFDGHQYRPVLCKRILWDEHGRELVRKRRCGSDAWSDMQSTGLATE